LTPPTHTVWKGVEPELLPLVDLEGGRGQVTQSTIPFKRRGPGRAHGTQSTSPSHAQTLDVGQGQRQRSSYVGRRSLSPRRRLSFSSRVALHIHYSGIIGNVEAAGSSPKYYAESVCLITRSTQRLQACTCVYHRRCCTWITRL
jgi:hypothetical protein